LYHERDPGPSPSCVYLLLMDWLVIPPKKHNKAPPLCTSEKPRETWGGGQMKPFFNPQKQTVHKTKSFQTKNDRFIPILARSSCTNFSLILGLARIQRVEKSCTQEPTYCSRRCLRQGLKIQPHNNCCLQLMILNSLFFNPKSSPLLPTTVYVSHTQNPKSKNKYIYILHLPDPLPRSTSLPLSVPYSLLSVSVSVMSLCLSLFLISL
jgi:hypothetical protein